jgi:Ca2+-dependent lipid-binding protein
MGRVKVTVVSCDGLPAKDVSGTTDAFIKVAVEDGIPGQVTFQTKVHKSLCPTFNETFEIPNTHRNAVITFALYDRDVASENDIIGVARLPVSRTTQRQPRRFRLPLIDHSAVAAFIVVKLETLDFGENDPFDEAAETAAVNDLFRLVPQPSPQ